MLKTDVESRRKISLNGEFSTCHVASSKLWI